LIINPYNDTINHNVEFFLNMEHNVSPTGEESIPENNQNNDSNMESLLKQEGLGIDFPAPGEIRTGVIASITPGHIGEHWNKIRGCHYRQGTGSHTC
jgi:hypothetical protein